MLSRNPEKMWAKVYSKVVIDGEYGFVPISDTVAISEQEYELFKSADWGIPSPVEMSREQADSMLPLMLYLAVQFASSEREREALLSILSITRGGDQ